MEEPEYETTFEKCIDLIKGGDIVEINCPRCATKTNFQSRVYFKTLP